jgi:hypothetical protein
LTNARLGILSDALFEKVCLAFHRDEIHPIKRIGRVENLGTVELGEQAIRDKLDVLSHESRVHPDQLHRERIGQELLFALDCFGNNFTDS